MEVGRRRRGIILGFTWKHLSRVLSYLFFVKRTDALNRFLFSFGRRYSVALQVWFSGGAFFGILAMVTSILVLAWQVLQSLQEMYAGKNIGADLSIVTPVVPGVNVPWSDIGYISVATTVGVGFHELGHALAAASEGVPTEYIAVFFAFIFSGAFVALSQDALQLLTPLRLLRVHCAGVWHNAVLCVACWLLLRHLPSLALPMYIPNNGPMVLGVPLQSPLAGHIRPGDMIKGIDNTPVYNTKDWLQKLQYAKQHELFSDRRGYCVPFNMLHGSSTPGTLQFNGIHTLRSVSFNASDILEFQKCGHSSSCSKMEECMEPQLPQGETLIRLSFAPFNNHSCKLVSPKMFPVDPCEQAMLFAGDPEALGYFLEVSDYLPRYTAASAQLPRVFEKLLAYTFGISAALAVLNSAPVFYLDGQNILDAVITSRILFVKYKREKVLRVCLVGGTMLFVMGILPGFRTAIFG